MRTIADRLPDAMTDALNDALAGVGIAATVLHAAAVTPGVDDATLLHAAADLAIHRAAAARFGADPDMLEDQEAAAVGDLVAAHTGIGIGVA